MRRRRSCRPQSRDAFAACQSEDRTLQRVVTRTTVARASHAHRRTYQSPRPGDLERRARGASRAHRAAPSPVPFAEGYATPLALSVAEIADAVRGFAAAARRARVSVPAPPALADSIASEMGA